MLSGLKGIQVMSFCTSVCESQNSFESQNVDCMAGVKQLALKEQFADNKTV